MTAVGLSPLLLFVSCLHLQASNAIDSSIQLFASPVKGDPHAFNLTWTIPGEQRPNSAREETWYFSISYAVADRYGCLTLTESDQRRTADFIPRTGSGAFGQYTLAGLEPNTMYFLYVEAFTLSFTFLELGTTVARTGAKIPVDSPTRLRLIRNESSTTSLRFAWDSIPCTAGSRSSPFLGYRYNVTSKEVPAGTSLETASAEALVADLEPYTQYGFQVQFKSASGYGPYTEPLYVVTTGRVTLSQETDVVAGETVELKCKSWGSSPLSIPGPDHLILGGPGGRSRRWSTRVSGLTRINHFRAIATGPDAEFTCTLHHDGVDEALGRDSLKIKVYAKPYQHTAPEVLMGVPSAGEATVTWLPWTADGGGDGPVDYQEVVWRREGDLSYENMAVEPDSQSAVLRDLDPGAKYEVSTVLFRKGIPGPRNRAMILEPATTTAVPDGPVENSARDGEGYHNLFGPETDNAIIAGVCGIFLLILILLSVMGVWCTNTKAPSGDEVPLTKGKN